VLKLSGPLVEEELAGLASTVKGLAEQGRRRLLLDLLSVPFVDSKAMEFLLDTAAELSANGGTLKVGGVSDVLLEAFVATRLSRSIELYKDRATGRRAFL
jgi:anti-anti-sigma factor